MCVRLNDGSTMWVPLSDLKEAQPIKTAEYARGMGLEDHPVFYWCISRTPRRARRILKAMRKRYFRTNQKYGIELPHTVERALHIDKETGTTF
jgi:hypothetical protein